MKGHELDPKANGNCECRFFLFSFLLLTKFVLKLMDAGYKLKK